MISYTLARTHTHTHTASIRDTNKNIKGVSLILKAVEISSVII